MKIEVYYHIKSALADAFLELVVLRPPPVADEGSKNAAPNKECDEPALRVRRTTIFGAGGVYDKQEV